MRKTTDSHLVDRYLMSENGANLIGDAVRLAEYLEGRQTQRAAILKAIEEQDWHGLFGLLGHAQRGFAFVLFQHDIDPVELNALLAEWWNMTEGVRPSDTLGLFRRAGLVTDGCQLPPGELTIYRGCRVPRHRLGTSWTLDADRARFFADRHGFSGTGVVYRARVESSDILGYFVSRKEDEVVVDPSTLRAIGRLDGFLRSREEVTGAYD